MKLKLNKTCKSDISLYGLAKTIGDPSTIFAYDGVLLDASSKAAISTDGRRLFFSRFGYEYFGGDAHGNTVWNGAALFSIEPPAYTKLTQPFPDWRQVIPSERSDSVSVDLTVPHWLGVVERSNVPKFAKISSDGVIDIGNGDLSDGVKINLNYLAVFAGVAVTLVWTGTFSPIIVLPVGESIARIYHAPWFSLIMPMK